MDELSDRELHRVRLRFIDLIKSFFVEEPDAEKMSRWRGTFSALSREQISPGFDAAVRAASELLGRMSLGELQEEYYQLFVNPFDGSMVETTASYYLNGRSYGQSLVEVRELMKEAGLRREDDVNEPEDSLVVLLDTFGGLVEMEKDDAGNVDVDKIQDLQERLLTEFLEPFAGRLAETLVQNTKARFYRLCCGVLQGYLDLEKGLVGAR